MAPAKRAPEPPPLIPTIEPASDPMLAVRTWALRMSYLHGPRVWDQEKGVWLDWEAALSKHCFGDQKEWLLDARVWGEDQAEQARRWEAGNWWPVWAVKAHLVDVMPCDFEDHMWKLVVNEKGTELVCCDPCGEARIFSDGKGRYVYPVCQNIPPMEYFHYEIEVKPEWVSRDGDEWWVELAGEILQEKPWGSSEAL